MNSMKNDLRKRLHLSKAYKRIERIKKFYLRLGVYCTVNSMLFVIWMIDPYMVKYFWLPTLSFTVGVAGLFIIANAVTLYGEKYIMPKTWEREKLEQLINKEKQLTKYE